MPNQASTANITPTILVVDDNVMSRAVIERRLSRDGFAVVTANSGIEALSMVSRQPVDLIFLDMVMDGMSGMDVLKELKADTRYQHIPIIIISGLEAASAAADCKKEGASDFLSKPVMAATLQEAVANHLGAASPQASGADVSTKAVDAGSGIADAVVFTPSSIEQLIKDYGKETAASFITQFEGLAQEHKDAIASARVSGSTSDWSRAAHDLKGGARTMGLSRLATVCRDIELACNEGRMDDAENLSDALNDCFNEALKGLRQYAADM